MPFTRDREQDEREPRGYAPAAGSAPAGQPAPAAPTPQPQPAPQAPQTTAQVLQPGARAAPQRPTTQAPTPAVTPQAQPVPQGQALGAAQQVAPNQQVQSYSDMLQQPPEAKARPEYSSPEQRAQPNFVTPEMPIGPAYNQSGYLNFDSLYKANKGVAQREANKLNKRISGAAQNTQKGLLGQQLQFNNSAGRGTFNKGPRDIDVRSSKQSDAQEDEQGIIDDEFYDSRAGTADYDGSRYLQGEGNNLISAPTYEETPSGSAGQGDLPDFLTQTPKTADEMAALAGQGYTGPNSLDEGAGYADLLAGAHATDSDLGALAGNGGDLNAGVQALLGPGATDADAALIGAAGRKDFADTVGKYGKGDRLESAVTKANEGSKARAAAAKKTSEDTAGAWKQLIGNKDAANKTVDDRAADIVKQDEEYAAREAENKRKEEEFKKASQWKAEDVLKLVSKSLNPIDWVTGGAMTNAITPQVEKAVNSVAGTHIDSSGSSAFKMIGEAGHDVYMSMTDDDWAYFNSLDDNGQQQWIKDRAAELEKQKKGASS